MTNTIEQAKTLLRSTPLPKDLVDYLVRYSSLNADDPRRETRAAEQLSSFLCYQVSFDASWDPDSDAPRPDWWYPGMPVSMSNGEEDDEGDWDAQGDGHDEDGEDGEDDEGDWDDWDDDASVSGNDDARITDEDAFPLGMSKYRGLPHLPPDMPWPEGLYFAAQLNLAQLARVDHSDRLPKDGMLYIFYNGGLEAQITHWRGPVEQLERRAYPELSTLPDAEHYYERFRAGQQIRFRPHWLLIESDSELYDHSQVPALLPAELEEAVSRVLGAPLATSDCIRRIYGRRFDYQDRFGYDKRGRPIDAEKGWMVLFHDEFGDAAVHFRCSPEAAARGDFSNIDVTASCT